MTIFLNKISKNIILIELFVIFIFILCKSTLVITTVKDASKIYFNNVFPCMFIFYTLGDLLINYDLYKIFNFKIFTKILKLDANSLLILFLSMILGFPSGSKYISYFLDKGYINYKTADKLLYVTHFSNPIFILGTISLITNKKLAIIIFISHYLGNIILLFLMRNSFTYNESNTLKIEKLSLMDKLNESFSNTLKIVIIVLFNTIIFITLASLINSMFKISILNLIIFMFFDITKGILSISISNFSIFIKGLLICFILTFGGLNIHNQVRIIIKDKKLNYSSFLKGRIISTLLSVIIYIFLFILV